MTHSAPKYKEPKNPIGRVAELFAGVGGFRIGLSRSGWKTVYSNQWEPSTKVQHASDVYVARFGPEGHSNKDIAAVDEIPADFELLVGGFPCQDYSVAKSATAATGLVGKKGVLWWEILRLVMKHQPKYIFLENVDRLLKSPSNQRGRDFAVMLSTLGGAGYAIEWRVVNAAEYGFPQRRIRVFIVATRLDAFNENINVSDYLFAEGILAKSLPIRENLVGVATTLIDKNAEKVSVNFNKRGSSSPFGNAGLFVGGEAHTTSIEAVSRKKPVTLREVLVSDDEVPSEFWVSKDKLPEWKYLKGSKSIDRVHKSSGFVYKYSEGSMAFPDSIDKPSRTILTGEGGTTPSRFKHIIQTERGYRRLLPLELERLSGFPDNWTNVTSGSPMSDAKRAFFIGNALVVGLVEKVGKELAARLLQG